MQAKILEIVEIKLLLFKSNPPVLGIFVTGNVSSLDWKNGTLIPYIYINPPDGGIYEFDFVAEPPSGIRIPQISSIGAQAEWHDFPKDLKGIKVYASANSQTQSLDNAIGMISLAEGGGGGNPHGLFVS